MGRFVKAAAAIAGIALALSGCSADPEVSVPILPPSSTAPVGLCLPGAAATAVNQLMAAAGTSQAIRVSVDQSTATMTYVADDQALTIGWDDGSIGPLDSDITYVGQASFDVASFNLYDVGLMFEEAAALAKSSQNQQLQITEYNAGRVLMTVTTEPESQTIFFQPDASLVQWLTFQSASDLAAALADVDNDGVPVLAIGLDDQGFYADVRISESIIERRTRPGKLPSYSAQRNATASYPEFDPRVVDMSVVADLLSSLPRALNKPQARVSFVIDMRDDLYSPVIRMTAGLTTRAFSLNGVDITDQLG